MRLIGSEDFYKSFQVNGLWNQDSSKVPRIGCISLNAVHLGCIPALEEAVVNTVYHRSYEQREPVEVRVNPDGIEIVSYSGPDASIRIEALNSEKIVARRYRNRRIGEFLKELELTEGRCTGIPKIRAAMEKNGSPPPRFSTDEGRTYFLVELPVHPLLPGVQPHDEAQVAAQVAAQVLTDTEKRILLALADGDLASNEIAVALGHSKLSGVTKQGLKRLESIGLIELTIPDKPRSRNQRRRLTVSGKTWIDSQSK